MTKYLLLFLSFTLLLEKTYSQKQITRPDGKTLKRKDIDEKVKLLMNNAGVTGLNIGIIQQDQPAYIKSYGYKNKTLGQPNSITTSFYAASFSKSLFAYLVMQLVDQRLIDLDKPIYQYLPTPLPEHKNYKDLAGDERWKLITARHCLSHTTGFPNWRFLNPRDNNKLEIFFTPGSRYAYSGEGLQLLQMVIEVITGKDLETLAKQYVFQPMGMSRTSYVWQPSFAADYASGHSVDEDTFAINKRKSANAAGSMQTTIEDYTLFMAGVLQGKGISAASKLEMLTPQIGIFTKRQFPSLNNDTTSENKAINLSYGLGWGLFNTQYGRAFFKEGHSDDGWEHYCIAIPGQKFSIILMSNSNNGESIYKELVEYLTGITIPWKWEGYTPYRAFIKVKPQVLEQYTGNYTGNIKAHISLENGVLKVEAKGEGLPKTGLYAINENTFFMKLMPVTLEFVKGPGGKIEKIKVDDEGDKFELMKAIPVTSTTEIKPGAAVLASYAGEYRLKGSSRMIKVEIKNNELLMILPNGEKMTLAFYSNTHFKAKSIVKIEGEFVVENGKTTKLVIEQDGRFEWEKLN